MWLCEINNLEICCSKTKPKLTYCCTITVVLLKKQKLQHSQVLIIIHQQDITVHPPIIIPLAFVHFLFFHQFFFSPQPQNI